MTRILLQHYFGINVPTEYRGENIAPLFHQSADAPLTAVKTHGIRKPPWPALVVCRDGRDAIVSYAHYMRHFNGSSTSLRRLMEKLAGSYAPKVVGASWSGFYRYWLDRHAGLVSLVHYEDLVADPLEALTASLRKLYPEVQLVHVDDPPTFAELKKWEPRFFREGVVGSWQEELPPAVQEKFWQNHGKVMEVLGYTR